MDASSAPAMAVLQSYGVRGCTDVSGFGLLGHLAEMLRASGLGAKVDLASVPLLPGALDSLQRGVESSLVRHNEAVLRDFAVAPAADDRVRVLLDPQTSGGLLAGIDASVAHDCVAALRAVGCEAAIIGRVCTDEPAGRGRIVAG
jgi:selenide,water dikinase